MTVPAIRIHKANQQHIQDRGAYVLYWMIASRRLHYNFALDRALEHCCSLRKSLLIFEPLRAGYRWASDRLHQFILEGMADNAGVCHSRGVRYFPYVEPQPGSGKSLLATLAENACLVVTDEFPCFFLPKMVASAAKQIPVLLEQVDSNGLLPLRATDHAALRAFDFRRLLQKELPKHLAHFPQADPLAKSKLPDAPDLPRKTLRKWPAASPALLDGNADALAHLPVDHSVPPSRTRGGHHAARRRVRAFFEKNLPLYAERRNQPESEVTSGFSPYLHFGHISAHEVFAELARREKWKPQELSLRSNGSRDGWWNMTPAAESFLDELITWREVGYNYAFHCRNYDQYDTLPAWAQRTLQEHASDERDNIYSLRDFDHAKTHDLLWNAAQTQLACEGTIHNYLRMLWGKKILEWSRTPQEAAKIMIHLNNKYALDGRDPNSYSGIFWVLGRYDRPWGPQRPIFGTVRYMSSENTARKASVKNYIRKYTPNTAQTNLSF